MLMARLPSLDEAVACVSYDPETGLFHRKHGLGGIAAGAVSGTVNSHGYVQLRINWRLVKAHRLAWFMTHGYWPTEIDHINGIRTDNRLSNLRESDKRRNGQNMRCHREGRLPGTCKAPSGRWSAQLTIGRKRKHIGTFDTEREAHDAYMAECRKLTDNREECNEQS